MFTRPIFKNLVATLLVVALSACSGAIYRQKPLAGPAPVAITVDARQRVLLSQLPQNEGLRRFCAEPSPDVFTVLGMSGGFGATLGLGADKSKEAALQGAFSSSETGATIARTQTVNMLREMMFRTCERFLSGAISPDEFPIVAARDQRIMVSVLAIEQLTGAVTPPRTAIGVGGTAGTGYDPSQIAKLLAAAQDEVDAAEGELTDKQAALAKVDAPPGTCAALVQNKADGELKDADKPKLAECEKAAGEVATATAARDEAKQRYAILVSASRRGLGNSAATTTPVVDFAEFKPSPAAQVAVANAVERIVGLTFTQDETQLFCIRALDERRPQEVSENLRRQCWTYLSIRVAADRKNLVSAYGLSEAEVRAALMSGASLYEERETAAAQLHICALNPEKARVMREALANDKSFAAAQVDAVMAAAATSETALSNFLLDQSKTERDRTINILRSVCNS